MEQTKVMDTDIARVIISGTLFKNPGQRPTGYEVYNGQEPAFFVLRTRLKVPNGYLTTWIYCRTTKTALAKLKDKEKVVVEGQITHSVTVDRNNTKMCIECHSVTKIS